MANAALTIRALSSSDFDMIAALAWKIWPEAYQVILTPIQLQNLLSKIYSPENLAKEVSDGHCFWGAYYGENALGFASGYRKGATIWIKKLYVLQSAHGQGVGRALMQAVIAHFSPAEDVRLFVNADNRAAQDFYVRMGFHNGGDVPVKMGDFNFTDYVFVKPL